MVGQNVGIAPVRRFFPQVIEEIEIHIQNLPSRKRNGWHVKPALLKINVWNRI